MGLWHDVRFAARLLLKERWFAAAAAVALALGIAVNATVFTLVNAVLLRGLPFEDPDTIIAIGSRDTSRDDDLGVSLADFEDWRATKAFEGMAVWGNYTFNLSDAGHPPDRFSGAYISAGVFSLIRQQPILGRNFRPEDDLPGAPPVLLISHSVWRSRYGGDPSVIGRAVTVNGFLPTIIGVMPEGLQFPNNNDLWVPLVHLPPGVRPVERNARTFQAFGRLANGASLERAATELTAITSRLAREYPATNQGITSVLMTFNERQNGGPIRLVFLSLMGAVGFVLLIACANVANLLLARSAHRAREISIRVALGASRVRVVRQLLVESVMLAAISGVCGYLLSTIGVRLFDQATQDVGRPSWIQFTMDGTVFFFIAAVSLGTGILFGLAPALHVSKTDVHDVLKEGGRTGAVGVRARRWTSTLIVAEMALTLVLLAGAGFMMRSFLALQRLDLGVDTSRLLTAQLGLPDRQYHEPEQRVRFFQQLEERLNAIAGADGGSVASSLPAMGGAARSLVVDGRAAQAGTELPLVTDGQRRRALLRGDWRHRLTRPRALERGRPAWPGERRRQPAPGRNALRWRRCDRPPDRLRPASGVWPGSGHDTEVPADMVHDRGHYADGPAAQSAGGEPGSRRVPPESFRAGPGRQRDPAHESGLRGAGGAGRSDAGRSRRHRPGLAALCDPHDGGEHRARDVAVHGVRFDVRHLCVHRAPAVGRRPVCRHSLFGDTAYAGDRGAHGTRGSSAAGVVAVHAPDADAAGRGRVGGSGRGGRRRQAARGFPRGGGTLRSGDAHGHCGAALRSGGSRLLLARPARHEARPGRGAEIRVGGVERRP